VIESSPIVGLPRWSARFEAEHLGRACDGCVTLLRTPSILPEGKEVF